MSKAFKKNPKVCKKKKQNKKIRKIMFFFCLILIGGHETNEISDENFNLHLHLKLLLCHFLII